MTNGFRFMDGAEYSVESAQSAVVYRMMDLSKFISILVRRQVAFCQADKFEDQWEAHLTPRDWHAYERFTAGTNAHNRAIWDRMTPEQRTVSLRKVGVVSC